MTIPTEKILISAMHTMIGISTFAVNKNDEHLYEETKENYNPKQFLNKILFYKLVTDLVKKKITTRNKFQIVLLPFLKFCLLFKDFRRKIS